MNEKDPLRVLIVGGGIAGLSTAISLSLTKKCKVSVLERVEEYAHVGAGIQAPPNSVRILDKWGVTKNFHKTARAPERMRFWSYTSDAIPLGTIELNPGMKEKYGATYWTIHRADMHKALLERARTLDVQLELGCKVSRIIYKAFPTPCHVELVDGRSFVADLVVGADGLRSQVRAGLPGQVDTTFIQPTGQQAYRFLVPLSSDDNNNVDLWLGPDQHCVIYPINSCSVNVVVLCKDTLPLERDEYPATRSELTDITKHWPATLQGVISQASTGLKWRLFKTAGHFAWTSSTGNAVIIGDSCHVTLPYLAQGAALAIEDADLLGQLIERQGRMNLPDLLREFETARKRRADAIVSGSSEHEVVFHLPDGDDQNFRDAHFMDANRSPILFIRKSFQEFMYGELAY